MNPIPDLLHVVYPGSGRRFLLRWYTDDDRGHVIVAHSKRAAELALLRVAEKEDGVLLVKDYVEAELVAPPPRLVTDVARFVREQDVDSFRLTVTSRVEKALKAGVDVPGFSFCTKYTFKHNKPGNKDWPSKDDKARHYECANCLLGVAMSMTPEELFDRYEKLWVHLDPSTRPVKRAGHVDPRRSLPAPSCARQAADDEPVRAVLGDYWDHGKGLYLQRELTAQSFRTNPLLFFVPIAELDMSEMTATCKAVRERREAERKEEAAKSAERKRVRDLAEAEKTGIFFAWHALATAHVATAQIAEVQAASVVLSKGWRKKAKLLWSEDECLLHDPDAERLDGAWQRLFGEPRPLPAGPELDEGDSFATPYGKGRVVDYDYTKCHAIWQMETLHGRS